MSHRDQDESQVIAAAKAGMSERTGRRIEKGECDAKYTPRQYSTREDPLAGVWESELVPMLENQPQLKPGTLYRELQKKHPGRYQHSVKRTLQRRVQKWKAMHGGDKEVMFPQKHEPGVLGFVGFHPIERREHHDSRRRVRASAVPFPLAVQRVLLCQSGAGRREFHRAE